ncbi:MAG: 2,3-bisphosphoglycerate-independent phosphoglycerate mutase [Verrucomicrobia bacterium]|nr:2,3-bisphosphoglycerate-independent phosphoglycerate mutase [Verrucomicrobiota bacterium]
MQRPVAIIIRDGWAINERDEGNAVAAAATPNIDQYKRDYPWTRLACSGEPVGLPDGYMGSSEVGHLNFGAGRIVIQELKRIDDDLRTGKLFDGAVWQDLMAKWKAGAGRLHLLGLLQDEGVHAHQEHLFKIMRRAREEHPAGEIILHPFLDGRDTPPRSSLEYLAKLRPVMAAIGRACIGTFMGRYYGMDRSQNWALTDQAYHGLVLGEGRPTRDVEAAIAAAYEAERTPDGAPMGDEYLPIFALDGYDGMRDGDCVLHTNYRQDRAIQLTKAFVEDDYPGQRRARPVVTFVGLTRYYDELRAYMMAPMSAGGGMENLLGEVVSQAGLRQLRIAETQKFPHVTSFFNGKATTPYAGEDDVHILSRFDASSFASHPEMDAYTVTDALLEKLEDNPYALIVVNFANGDMVGHTGDFDATRRAIEIVDTCVGRVVEKLLTLDAHIFVTADHGNADQMIDYETGMVKTSHSLFDVECIYVAKDSPGTRLLERGKLSDVAPTTLHLLGLPIPSAMTADNLIRTD